MEYCITMEKTQRIAVWFEADNDNTAIREGLKILAEHQSGGFDGGDIEYDYAIDDADNRAVVTWSD